MLLTHSDGLRELIYLEVFYGNLFLSNISYEQFWSIHKLNGCEIQIVLKRDNLESYIMQNVRRKRDYISRIRQFLNSERSSEKCGVDSTKEGHQETADIEIMLPSTLAILLLAIIGMSF